MYSATFIFEKKTYDPEFERLDALIMQAAERNAGYLGHDGWESPSQQRTCVVYYWRTLADLQTFAADPSHIEAKKGYAAWYSGYQVIIAEVLRTYGDGNITSAFNAHPTRQTGA